MKEERGNQDFFFITTGIIWETGKKRGGVDIDDKTILTFVAATAFAFISESAKKKRSLNHVLLKCLYQARCYILYICYVNDII